MPRVVFKRAAYDGKVRSAVFDLLDDLAAGSVRKNTRVLIKPNLLSPAKPETGILTHPLVVRAAAEYVLARGGRVQISDSPAMGSFERVLKEGAYRDTFDGLSVDFKPFRTTVRRNIGKPFGTIDLAADIFEADIVINLPKLKTHSQMLLTLGVKNTFGCVVGTRKPEWHMRCGVNRETFARLLVQIHHVVNPAVTLVDGILALEGQGPGRSGTPRPIGTIIASKSAMAVDEAICRMLDLDPENLPTHLAAKNLGLIAEPADMQGDFMRIEDFVFPVLGRLTFGPNIFSRFMRRYLVQRPRVDPDLCRLCVECLQICPAQVIRRKKERIVFDYDRCIRCYCCIEICPHGALQAEETLIGQFLRRTQQMVDATR